MKIITEKLGKQICLDFLLNSSDLMIIDEKIPLQAEFHIDGRPYFACISINLNEDDEDDYEDF